MAYVGTLAINVVANTAKFSSGLRSGSRDVENFTTKCQGAATDDSPTIGSRAGCGRSDRHKKGDRLRFPP